MKKIFAIAMAALLCLSLFTACGGDKGGDEAVYDVNEVLRAIEEVTEVRMATAVDEEYLQFIGITDEMYDAYAGSYCPITPGVDIILVIQAKSDKVADVQSALEARRQEIFNANENYIGALRDKAEAGRVIVKGNYVLLVIAGDDAVVEDEGVEKAYEPIDEAIDKAFN